MKIDWKEFERGFVGEKQAGKFGDWFQPGKIMDGVKNSVSGWFGGGGGNTAGGTGLGSMLLPLAGMMKGNGVASQTPQAGAVASPNITVNLGNPKNILTSRPGEVNSMNNPKTAGLIDPNMVRSVLTAKAINGISNTLQVPVSQEAQTHPTQLQLEAQHPEMKKLLEDPSTREYLEKLLTEEQR